MRAGRLYTAIDGLASPPSFEFTAVNSLGTVGEGATLGVGGPVTLHIRSNAPSEFTTVVWDGTKVVDGDRHGQDLTVQASDKPATYHVEIRSTGRPTEVAWVRSNAIYVRAPEATAKLPVRPPPTKVDMQFEGKTVAGWRVEHDDRSAAAVELAPITGELRVRYALGKETPAPFATLVHDTPHGIASNDRLAFTVRAERPTRISVQLRVESPHVQRWQRSVYVDAFAQERTVYFDDLTPVGATETWKPPLADVRHILFVVDTTNTKPGTSGRFWIKSAALER